MTGRPPAGGVNRKLASDSYLGGWWAYFAPHGWATQWYWPEGTRGKVHNLLHGKGWRVG